MELLVKELSLFMYHTDILLLRLCTCNARPVIFRRLKCIPFPPNSSALRGLQAHQIPQTHNCLNLALPRQPF